MNAHSPVFVRCPHCNGSNIAVALRALVVIPVAKFGRDASGRLIAEGHDHPIIDAANAEPGSNPWTCLGCEAPLAEGELVTVTVTNEGMEAFTAELARDIGWIMHLARAEATTRAQVNDEPVYLQMLSRAENALTTAVEAYRLLDEAERFIAGFEDDETQEEPIDPLLHGIRRSLTNATAAYGIAAHPDLS